MSSADHSEQQRGSVSDAVVGDRALAAWEIASVASSILIAEWILAAMVGRSKFVVAIPIALAFMFMIYSHRLRGETLRDVVVVRDGCRVVRRGDVKNNSARGRRSRQTDCESEDGGAATTLVE